MKKIALIALLTLNILGCATQKNATSIETPITTSHVIKPFQTLVISGKANIELINGPYAVTTTGLAKKLNSYHEHLKDRTLYIDAPATVTIQLAAPELKLITATNSTILTAKDFKTNHLTLIAKHNATINLAGQLNIDRIYQYGNGRININWISSNNLAVTSSANGPIYLAGIANTIVAKLTNHTQLDARYLRTQKAIIFATDSARADISPLESLDAFAVNNSNIFYYKRPQHLNVVTKDSGNVLHLDWIK